MTNKAKWLIVAIIAVLSWFVFCSFSQAKSQPKIKIEGATRENPMVYLGKKYDKQSKKEVEGYAIVHYAKDSSKPASAKATTCYTFISKGAKWRSIEPWVVNTTNVSGLTEEFVLSNLQQDIIKFEEAAGVDILGEGSTTNNFLEADQTSTDGLNEVMFGSIDHQGAIAVTIVWGIFGGNPNTREIVEWDMIFDEVDFRWGIGEADKMDFENIATHELGHAMGLGDLYTEGCNQETMYGYATEGEITKRTLNAGDILGIQKLY